MALCKWKTRGNLSQSRCSWALCTASAKVLCSSPAMQQALQAQLDAKTLGSLSSSRYLQPLLALPNIHIRFQTKLGNRYGKRLQTCDKVHQADIHGSLSNNGIWTPYGNPLLFTSHLLSARTVFAPAPSSAVCSGRLCMLSVGKSFYTCWSSLLEHC